MKQDIRTCAYCGKWFVHQGRGQRKYCCVECNWKAQNEKKLRKRLEEAGEDYARRYYVKRMILAISKRQHGMKVRCEQCGREFPFRGNNRGDASRFCSRECAFEWYRHHPRRGHVRTAEEIAKAEKRHAELVVRRKAEKHKRHEALKHQTCKFCGKEFSGSRFRDYCSNTCRQNAYYAENPRMCVVCGKPFAMTVGGDKKCCSDTCRDAYEKIKRYRENHRHDKRLKGKVIDNDITLKSLAKREYDRCWLCGEKVDWHDYEIRNGAFIAGDSYPSIDHIIPLSQGGMHKWGNIHLAHRHCNSVKGGSWLCSEILA